MRQGKQHRIQTRTFKVKQEAHQQNLQTQRPDTDTVHREHKDRDNFSAGTETQTLNRGSTETRRQVIAISNKNLSIT